MNQNFILFAVFLSIFLFGMIVMRTGLYNLSENKLKVYLSKLTNHPIKGLIVGTLTTAIIQSSSAVMVLTIGLVAASHITFKQSIGIILGANIGTTFTAELITINIESYILPLLIIGAILLIQNHRLLFCIGSVLFGLGCIFVSMNGFETLATPLSSISIVHTGLELANQSEFIGVLLGTILTAIIQSSTAVTGIIMSFLNENLISLPASIAVVLGANIGTCVTAYLASLTGTHEAKLTAYAHIWINILGVIIFFPFIHLLGLAGSMLTTLPDVQLAHVSLIFNVLSSLIALPFVGLLSSFILRLHGKE